MQRQRQHFAVAPERLFPPYERLALKDAASGRQIVNWEKRILTGRAKILQSRPFVPQSTGRAAKVSEKHFAKGAYRSPLEKRRAATAEWRRICEGSYHESVRLIRCLPCTPTFPD